MVFAISKEGKRRILGSGYVNAGLKSKELLLNLLFRVYHTAPCQLPSKTTDPTQKLVPYSPLHRSVGGNGANKALFFPLQTFILPTTEMISGIGESLQPRAF